MPYYITPNYSLAFIPKSGCSTFARATLNSFYPEEEALIQGGHYPEGKTADNTQWQFLAKKEHYPSKPVIAFIRHPLSRFLSAMAQENLTDVDQTIDSVVNGTPIGTMPKRNRPRILARSPHFVPQIKFVTPTAKLYKFPDHLSEGWAEIGFTTPLLTVNAAKRPKPTLTAEQEQAVLEIYSEDLVLFNSITQPGIVTGIVWSQYEEPPSNPPPTDPEQVQE